MAVDVSPRLAAVTFGDAGQQEGEPADEDVGVDAVFEAVEDRAEQEVGLEFAEAAFGFEEVLVAQGGFFGRSCTRKAVIIYARAPRARQLGEPPVLEPRHVV